MASNCNPSRFANCPRESVLNVAKKGGEHSHSGGFASMDLDEQLERTFQD